MNNVFGLYSVDWWYDLKGSNIARRTIFKDGIIDYKISLKDMDFIDWKEIIDIENDTDWDNLAETIKWDSEFLASCNILDYSLLLGIIDVEAWKQKYYENQQKDAVIDLININPWTVDQKGVYFNKGRTKIFIIGVIDTLTEYTAKKKFEYYSKWCWNGIEMSCIPPNLYCWWYGQFMDKVVLSGKEPFEISSW